MARKPLWTAADQKRNPKRLILREKREAAGLTLEDVASHIGMSFSNYSRRELNPHLLKEGQLRKLAQLFGCSMDELNERGEAPGPTLATVRRVVPVYKLAGDQMLHVAELSPHIPLGIEGYGIEVPDDALRGADREVIKGEWAIVDPKEKPQPGDIVHAIDPATGNHVLRLFVPLHPSNPRAPGAVLRAGPSSMTDEIYIPGDAAGSILGVVVGKQVSYRRA